MSRKTYLTAAVLAAVLLGAFLLLWILSMKGGDSEAPMAEIEGGEAEKQTPPAPRVQPKKPPKETPKMDDEADAGPYNVKNWQEALDLMAEEVGKEYDRLVEAGVKPQPHMSLAGMAYQNFRKRVFEDKEDLALYNALRPYIPYAPDVPMEKRTGKERIPDEERGAEELLVRSGRLPRTALQGKMTLPNGETYYVDKKEELYITWQKSHISPKQKQALARLETARGELERRLKQTPGDQQTKKKLADILESIEKVRSAAGVTTYEAVLMKGVDPAHPKYKFTFLDLGDIGKSAQESGDSK
ncbi:MAG: hypothetical protein OXT69_01095 [Candidatus Poribacteria bacterium]|nr:hypothetical protein [Candidatus Poribacteria bacterium]